MSPSHTLTIRRLAAIEAALTKRAMTGAELAEAIHIGYIAALRYMRDLSKLEQVHIEKWKRSGVRHWSACYRWGKGVNALKPDPIPNDAAQRDYRARIRKDPVANALFLARHRAQDRARSAIKKAAKKPQTWLSALM